MTEFHDINRLTSDGSLVLPLSMSKLHGEQSPASLYEFLDYFESKIPGEPIDVIFLYTNGLYFNADETSYDLRLKTNSQMVQHVKELKNKILKGHKFIPQAFHFLPWDYAILNAEGYQEALSDLKALRETDKEFENTILNDLEPRAGSEANIGFVLEELTITNLIRQGRVRLPTTLSPEDGWKLICYPGEYIKSDAYLFYKDILQDSSKDKKYAHSFYNMKDRVLYDYAQLNT